MGFLRRHILLKVFMAVCALAQAAAVMPHHHHGGTDTPCINPLHCLETTAHAHHLDSVAEHTCTGDAGNCGDTNDGSDCAGFCAGHLCLHNTSGHRNGTDGNDCSFSHLDLNPPAKDKLIITAPVLELAWIYITTFPPLEQEGYCCGHCRSGDIMACSVHSGTIALYSSYSSAALPPRAPSC